VNLERVIIVLGDPGSVKPILSWARMNFEAIGSLEVLARSEHKFYVEKGITSTVCDVKEGLSFYTRFNPTFVLLGTSYPSNAFEISILRKATNDGIKVVSFFDHWQNFKARFIYNGVLSYPNEIWVMDEIAYEIASMEGIPKQKLIIEENPYFQKLKNWKQLVDQSEGNIKSIQLINEDYILFLPDFIADSNESAEVYGFDEFSVLADIVDIMKSNGLLNIFKLKIRLHPSHSIPRVLNHVSAKFPNSTKDIIIDTDSDIKELVYSANCVVGMFSNALLEAQIINNCIIRYLPKMKIRDPLSHLPLVVSYNKISFNKNLQKISKDGIKRKISTFRR
jgi:hypothetical protein